MQDRDRGVNPTQGDPDAAIEDLKPSIPEKYQGKTAEELVAMHQQAQSTIGKQSQELGQLRKMAALQAAQAAPAPEQPKWDPDNPDPYIQHLVDQRMAPAAHVIEQTKQQSFEAALDRKHPDWRDVVGSEDFGDWVADADHPKRLQLYNEADQGFDHESADLLIDMFKSLNDVGDRAAAAAESAVKREDAIRKAAVEKGRSGAGLGTGKVLRRADIRALRQHRPEEYQRRAAEIRQAYAEGRVRD